MYTNNFTMMHLVPLQIREIIQETDDFKTFVLHASEPITYRAGQYITFVHDDDGTEVRRSYSIISSPAMQEQLAIGVKRIPNGMFSRYLFDRVQVGCVLHTTGAAGFFTLPYDVHNLNDIFLFAAGSGITPILSLAKEVLAAGKQHVHLFYSAPSAEACPYFQHLNELQIKRHPRLHINWFFGTAQDLSAARLNKEKLQQLVKATGAQFRQSLFYTCGPEAYMRMCTYALQEMGVTPDKIRKEDFAIVKKPPPPLLPPDTAAHAVSIHNGAEHFIVEVAYPDTILSAAKNNHVQLPFSCEVGKCGSCAARCTRGEVWMSTNEVLTENEVKRGLVLTCVGYPVNGPVSLEF